MSWDANKVKTLRRRLGWSQAELARRLNCEWSLVLDWEATDEMDLEILPDLIDALNMLEKHAQSEAEQVAEFALAELVLDETSEDQVDRERVKKRFLENN